MSDASMERWEELLRQTEPARLALAGLPIGTKILMVGGTDEYYDDDLECPAVTPLAIAVTVAPLDDIVGEYKIAECPEGTTFEQDPPAASDGNYWLKGDGAGCAYGSGPSGFVCADTPEARAAVAQYVKGCEEEFPGVTPG